MKEYLDQYYETVKKNKSTAEMKWQTSVKQILLDELKNGKEIRKLYNEAQFSKFAVPNELKQLVDLETKVGLQSNALSFQRTSIFCWHRM